MASAYPENKIDLLENDIFAVVTKLLDKEKHKMLPSLVQVMSDMRCVSVTSCCHGFSGLPPLYTFMTSGFKCPFCQYGGKAKIDIAAAPQLNCNIE